MSKFGGIPVQQGGSKFGGVPVGTRQETPRPKTGVTDRLRQGMADFGIGFQQVATDLQQKAQESLPEWLGNALTYEIGKGVPTREELARRREIQKQAARDLKAEEGDVGFGGGLVQSLANPTSYVGGPLKLAAPLAAGLATFLRSEGEDKSLGDRAVDSAINAGVARVVAPLADAGVRKAATAVSSGVSSGVSAAKGGLSRALAATGSKSAADDVAYRNAARLLRQEGYAPGEVASILDEFRAQGIRGGTLGQMLQSGDLLAREKNLLQGGGKAGRVMAENLRRQPGEIADSVLATARGYAQPDQTAYLYKQAAEVADAPTALSGGKVTGTGRSASQQELPFTLNAIDDDLASRADELPANVLKRIQRIVSTAKSKGGFEAADTAKKQLDDLYKDNPLTTDQEIINEAVLGYRRMLNDALESVGGPIYQQAKEAAKRDMAMRDVQDAVRGAQGTSIRTALNKFFGSREAQEEFMRKLPDDKARAEFAAYLDNLQKVSGRFGGSDTASNTATARQMGIETGFGFDGNVVNPQSWVNRLSEPISRNVRRAQAEMTFAPNAERLAAEMRRIGRPNSASPTARALGGKAADATARAATQAGVTAGGKDGPTTQPTPPPARAKAPAPQSNASPLVRRMAMAESGGDPNAVNPVTKAGRGTASGLLQFTDDTWARSVAKWGKELGVTLKDKNRPEAQLAMAEKLAADNARILGKQIGRPPTEGEVYAAHFLGASDAARLIRAQGSGRQAILLFPRKVVNDNRSVFFDGRRPRSVEEVMRVINDKVA